MVCPNCKQPTSRLIIDKHGKACADCRGLSSAGGSTMTGVLTRSSFRVREQQRQSEGDMITPHIYDKQTKRVIPNPDFVKNYSDKLPDYFKPGELEGEGYSKAGDVFKHRKTEKAKAQAAKNEGVTFKPGTPDIG